MYLVHIHFFETFFMGASIFLVPQHTHQLIHTHLLSRAYIHVPELSVKSVSEMEGKKRTRRGGGDRANQAPKMRKSVSVVAK